MKQASDGKTVVRGPTLNAGCFQQKTWKQQWWVGHLNLLGTRKNQRTWFIWQRNSLKIFLVPIFLEKNNGVCLVVKKKKSCNYDVRKEENPNRKQCGCPKTWNVQSWGGPRTVSMCIGRNDLCSVGRMVTSTATADSWGLKEGIVWVNWVFNLI